MICKGKKMCTGCFACYNICPKHCIIMEKDEEGFWYPKIDSKNCIECKKCEQFCPILQEKFQISKRDAYAAVSSNATIVKKSSSGGLFSVFAQAVLEENGTVYGAAFNEDYMVEHKGIVKKEDLESIFGSKYVQSRIGSVYREIEQKLKVGESVYFSGTPCQVNGLKVFLNKEYENLISQDIICHGTPSPKMWEHYLKSFKLKKGAKISFRDKSTGWESYSFVVSQGGKKFKQRADDNMYMRAFINNYTLRPSCYTCKIKGENRRSDITLGDFWGIKNVFPDFYDKNGVSLVVLNSEKGRAFFEKIRCNIKCKKVELKEAIRYNPSYETASCLPEDRDQFMQELFDKNFNRVVSVYCKEPWLLKIKIIAHRILSKLNKKD